MKTTFRIEYPELFKNYEIDCSELHCTDIYNGIRGNFCATGTLVIYQDGKEIYLSSGEFGQRDYVDEYGFTLQPDYDASNTPIDERFL